MPVLMRSKPLARERDIHVLPPSLKKTHTGLSPDAHKLLLTKSQTLASTQPTLPDSPSSIRNVALALSATLIFAQHEAGTAVCISPDGLVLTCAHCIAETRAEAQSLLKHPLNKGNKPSLFESAISDPRQAQQLRWLIFPTGRIAAAECVAWDDTRDLALLQIVAAQALPQPPHTLGDDANTAKFPHIYPAARPPRVRAALICIGQPGSEDLESSSYGPTDYALVHVSEGRYRGCAKGQDVQDNSEIGALMHDCWTYWGHSGAPLVLRDAPLSRSRGGSEAPPETVGRATRATSRQRDVAAANTVAVESATVVSARSRPVAEPTSDPASEQSEPAPEILIGLHSSWDDQTGMRRGVPLDAVRSFLNECGVGVP